MQSLPPEMIWDAFKAHSRGQYISAVAAVRAEQREIVYSLQTKVDQALTQHSSSPTATNFDYLSSLKRDLHLLISEVTRLGIQTSR